MHVSPSGTDVPGGLTRKPSDRKDDRAMRPICMDALLLLLLSPPPVHLRLLLELQYDIRMGDNNLIIIN